MLQVTAKDPLCLLNVFMSEEQKFKGLADIFWLLVHELMVSVYLVYTKKTLNWKRETHPVFKVDVFTPEACFESNFWFSF